MNFSQGHSGTKAQCESCLFSKEKHQNSHKNGREIHELFVLGLFLVCFAGVTPEIRVGSESDQKWLKIRSASGLVRKGGCFQLGVDLARPNISTQAAQQKELYPLYPKIGIPIAWYKARIPGFPQRARILKKTNLA